MEQGSAFGLRTEISGELASALAAVVETSAEGGRRYGARACRSLVQTIAARAYGRPLLELAFLIGAADRIAGRGSYVGFLWGVRAATASAFKASALASPATGDDVRAEAGELVLLNMRPEFRISYSRIPFLAALLDFCVTSLGFDVVDGEISSYLAGPRDHSGAQELANALSRKLYEFLKGHLPSQQYERKFNAICGFISERTGQRPIAEDVDDRTVLAFWEQRCKEHGAVGDFRGFRTVALDCLRLRAALKEASARRAVESAAPIGPARDQGEVDPEQVREALETIDEKRAVLAELAAPPADRLKSVNKREAARLETVLEAGEAAGLLPLTILRSEVFGAHQARIIQALRRHGGDGMGEAAAGLIGAEPDETYNAAVTGYSAISTQLRKTRKALMYILFRNRRPEALSIAAALCPDALPALRASLTGDGQYTENVVLLHPDRAARDLIGSALTGDPDTCPEAALYRSARIAFAKVNRRGFEEHLVFDPETVEAAEASDPLIERCNATLQDLLGALTRHFDLIPADQVFIDDCRRFRAALSALYREPA
ncbi:hypothetical protein NUH88_05990 [Nisaea acidiphila]|uniref:Uncharacterized protein n=1 Tax=Nisaea acidiphila TaxID=1862145 RepID=A0A9J7AV85_9PROT|nr:hypothetical protein [Nisaea acidiphila]UUX51240.1 hypothetical protein NUH88_05990 [Nisaea acidiphila]